ncbi:phosphotransferase enzyme family protein [Promicromonospora sp. Populi]|uniref:phosphotransferase enzyme family protein n=1 Tax=Promicromonospora sp. Populi TaxID=3239420 RepID=UPI0034E1CEAD
MELHALAGLLDLHWGLTGAVVAPLGGGMNSETWSVDAGSSRYVAKRVAPSEVEQLEAGCAVAEQLHGAGLVTGRPIRTVDGSLVAYDEHLALLEYVPGRELVGETSDEQRWIGRTLARVHSAGGPSGNRPGSTGFFDWIEPSAPGVDAHDWLAPAIEAARAATDGHSVTWSLLHADPSPEAFRHDDATGVTGVIDWTGAQRGPALYDVASTVMYLGGPERSTAFLDAYSAASPLADDELRHLDDFRLFRFAVQGVYFAGRLAAYDLTGITDQSENQKGLDDARRGLAELLPQR